MILKRPILLLLIFLGAAAAPPDDCTPGVANGAALPSTLDLAGRPGVTAGLSGQNFATLPNTQGVNGCRSGLSSASQSTTLRSETGDVLHGLPAPELLQRIDEPKRAPAFQ